MSPVARRPGGAHTGRAVLVALFGVVVALGVAYGVATLVSRGEVDVKLGDARFNAGRTENLARIIGDDGQPVLFPDPATFSRAIYVDHAGSDPDSGWKAFGAFVPERPECTVLFHADVERFVADCDASITYPRSGDGLRRFPTEVVDGRLFVDLQDASTTTTAG